jgi:hypothetical protein
MVKTLLGLLIAVSINQTPVKINYLIEHAMTRDQQTVIIQAEAIGEVLERGDHAWINVNDGDNAIGVFMTIDQAKQVNVFGGYANIGDTIKVIGTFNRACVEHGGEMDIHAISITVIKAGQPTTHEVSSLKFVMSIILLTIALAGLYLRRHYFSKQKIDIN